MKDVYTLADLRDAKNDPDDLFYREVKPARLAVLGDPVAHSKSPQLHQPALDALGINAQYIRVHLTAEEFNEGVNLMQALGFIGCNCTVPHKERALAWAKHPDRFAAQLGVANTLLFGEGRSYTTDPVGCESAVREELGLEFQGKNILILGAGGGAGSAVAQYLLRQPVNHVFLYNRTPEKLDDLYQKVINLGDVDLTKLSLYGNGEYPSAQDLDLIINATSLGLKEEDASPIPESFLQAGHHVYDMTYGCENALAKGCKKVGAKYADGLSMLRHQGAEAFKLWFPGTDPLSVMGLG